MLFSLGLDSDTNIAGLNVFGMLYINLSSVREGVYLSFVPDGSTIIEIPVVHNARTKPGKTMPAWRFHRDSGM